MLHQFSEVPCRQGQHQGGEVLRQSLPGTVYLLPPPDCSCGPSTGTGTECSAMDLACLGWAMEHSLTWQPPWLPVEETLCIW